MQWPKGIRNPLDRQQEQGETTKEAEEDKLASKAASAPATKPFIKGSYMRKIVKASAPSRNSELADKVLH